MPCRSRSRSSAASLDLRTRSPNRSTRRGRCSARTRPWKQVCSLLVKALHMPPNWSISRAMSRTVRRGVPLKAMCSRKGVRPFSAPVSSLEPTLSQIPTAAEWKWGTSSVTTRSPLLRTLFWFTSTPAIGLVTPAIGLFRLGVVIRDQGLAGQANLPLPVHVQHLDHHDVALLEDLVHGLHPAMGQFRNMDQTVGARQNLHKGAEVHELLDDAPVGGANFRLRGDLVDHPDGFVGRFLVGRGDVDLAVVFDVHLDPGGGYDGLDHFAAGSDHVPDLVGIDGEHDDLGGVFLQSGRGRGDGLF